MLVREEVADRIVHVTFEIAAERVAVVGRPGYPDAGRILVGIRNRCPSNLSEVLTACRFYEPVEGVVGVIGARLDTLIAEVHSLLRVVLNMSDIARRVVCVTYALRFAA